MKIRTKRDRRDRICLRQRKRIAGTSERPRLAVFRSGSHIYAQVIDDLAGRTVASAGSTEASLKSVFTGKVRGGNRAGAEALGKVIADRLKDKGLWQHAGDGEEPAAATPAASAPSSDKTGATR